MKPLTTKQAARWRKTRQIGRGRYTLIYGVLLWGLSSGVIWAVAMSWMMGWERLPIYLVGAVVAFPLAGTLWGRLMWRILEARHAATPREKAKRR
jgi:hypothetical protein